MYAIEVISELVAHIHHSLMTSFMTSRFTRLKTLLSRNKKIHLSNRDVRIECVEGKRPVSHDCVDITTYNK